MLLASRRQRAERHAKIRANPPMPIRGVIFDLDGTIADTLPVCFAAFREVFQDALGRDYSDQEVRAMFGPAEEGVFQRVVPDDWERRMEQYLAAYQRQHSLCPEPFPGMRESIDELCARGIRLAVVTGKGPRSAAISLRELGLEGIFDPVEAGSPNGGVKPAAMRRVLDFWGLEPSGGSISRGRAARHRVIPSVGDDLAGGCLGDHGELRDAERPGSRRDFSTGRPVPQLDHTQYALNANRPAQRQAPRRGIIHAAVVSVSRFEQI